MQNATIENIRLVIMEAPGRKAGPNETPAIRVPADFDARGCQMEH
jgi:hypothetical protein